MEFEKTRVLETSTNNIVPIIKRLKEEAKEYENRYRSQDETFIQAYKGDHWPNVSYSPYTKWKTRQAVNYTGDSIDLVTSVLMEQSLRPYTIPPSEDQEPFVLSLQECIDEVWRENKMDSTNMEDLIKGGLILGKTYLKVYFDPLLNENQGSIIIDVVEPKNVHLDPTCKGDIKKARYLIWENTIPYEEALRRFPNFAKEISKYASVKPDKDQIKEGPSQTSIFSLDGTKTWDLPLMTPSGGSSEIKDNRLVMPKYPNKINITEAWLRDYSDIGEGKDRRQQYRNNIRLVTLIGDVVVQDRETPYNYVKHFPWAIFMDKKIPFESNGVGTVSQVWQSQMDVNKKKSYIGDYIKFAGNPVWIIDKGANVKRGDISNIPGLIISPEDGKRVERKEPPGIPAGFFETIKEGVQEIRELSGALDSISGRATKGSRSGAQIAEVKESAMGKIMLKKLALKETIASAGNIILGLIRQYYTESKVMRIAGEYHKPMYLNFSGLTIDGPWRIKVETAPSTPSTKQARFDQAIRLYSMKLIDRQSVLDTLDWPNKDRIMQRMNESQQAYFQAIAQRKATPSKKAAPP